MEIMQDQWGIYLDIELKMKTYCQKIFPTSMFKSFFFLKLSRVLLGTNVEYNGKALSWRWTVLSVTIIYSLN